jgi:hypothetical protein
MMSSCKGAKKHNQDRGCSVAPAALFSDLLLWGSDQQHRVRRCDTNTAAPADDTATTTSLAVHAAAHDSHEGQGTLVFPYAHGSQG